MKTAWNSLKQLIFGAMSAYSARPEASGELRSGGARGRGRSVGRRLDDDLDFGDRFGFREDFSRTVNDCPTW